MQIGNVAKSLIGVFILVGVEAVIFCLLYLAGDRDLLEIGLLVSFLVVFGIGPTVVDWLLPGFSDDRVIRNGPKLTLVRSVICILLVSVLTFAAVKLIDGYNLGFWSGLAVAVGGIVLFIFIVNFLEMKWAKNDLGKTPKK